jgi:RNA polymerase subunit RPABC4/transcription elongation factor Spt4
MPALIADVPQLVLILGFAYLAAFWISLDIWTIQDIRARSRDGFTRFLAALLVVLFFLPGWFLYLLWRPRATLEEKYRQSLEEEWLLHNIPNRETCPGCGRVVQDDWLLCPACQTPLKRSCAGCSRPLELAWEVCPYCATPAPVLDPSLIK